MVILALQQKTGKHLAWLGLNKSNPSYSMYVEPGSTLQQCNLSYKTEPHENFMLQLPGKNNSNSPLSLSSSKYAYRIASPNI